MKPLLLLIALASAVAQSVTISPAVFSGTGLNDATSGGRFTGAAANALYNVAICAAGTPDTAKVQKNGGAFGACSPLLGVPQAIGDGVTITFGATTGHTVADAWTIAATASGSAGAQSFIQGGVGATFRPDQDKARETLSVRDFGIAGSASNATAVFQAAGNEALRTGKAVYVPAGSYAICSLTFTGSNQVMWIGDGMGASVISRHSSCLQAHTNMVNATVPSFAMRGVGFDMLTDGTWFGNSILSLNGVSSVVITDSYFAHAQAVGIQMNDCSHVRILGNKFKENWWFGLSFGSTATTASPVYVHDYTITGNTFENTPIGIGGNFFSTGISITGNVLDRSNISLTQMPNAQATVTGNTISGTAAYGCGAGCGGPNFAGIFLEGVANATIANNQISGTLGEGILCQGTFLQIPLSTGTVTQLPCKNLNITGNQIDGVASRIPILLSSASTSGTLGSQITLDNNSITNSLSCTALVSAEGVNETNEKCDNSSIGGFAWTRVKRSSFRNNRGHNIGNASSGSYIGWELADALSVDVDVFNNEMINDGAFGMASCYKDSTLIGGAASQVRHWSNKCRGGGQWLPIPAIPTIGTWASGDLIENPNAGAGGNGQTLGWVNVTPGAAGTFQFRPVNLLPDSLGFYQILDPATPNHLLSLGVDHTSGEGNLVCFDLGAPAFKACRTTGLGLKIVNGNTGVVLWSVDASGLVNMNPLTGGGKRPVCVDNSGNLYAGTTGPLACP